MGELAQENVRDETRLTDQRLELILRSLDALSTFPCAVARLLKLTNVTDVSGPERTERINEIARVVECDPVLTAKLLSEANRSGDPDVLTVEAAINKIGLEAVRTAALDVGLFNNDEKTPLPPKGLDWREFWRHCIAVALAAEMLSKQVETNLDPKHAFVCGLLHDLGKLALVSSFPKGYAKALEAARRGDTPLTEQERKVLGTDHTIAGKKLAELWELPEPVANVIWFHHHPLEALPSVGFEKTLVGVVAVANVLVRRGGIGDSGNHHFTRNCEETARQLGISEESLSRITDGLAKTTDQRIRLLGLDETPGDEMHREAITLERTRSERTEDHLRAENKFLSDQVRALGQLRNFAAGLAPDSTIWELLVRIAKVFCSLPGCSATDSEPVVAYCLSEQDEVVTVRWGGSGAPACKVLEAPLEKSKTDSARPTESAQEIIDLLSPNGSELDNWIDASCYAHYPLLRTDKWIGGVFYPRGKSDRSILERSPDVRGTLQEMLGLGLGFALQRDSAVRLSEQLAQGSRVLADTQEALAEARTIAGIREMAAGAAHELNTPLAIISGRAQLMQGKSDSDENREIWSLISEQAQKISDIITELMEFTSPPTPRIQVFGVRELLSESAETFVSSDHPRTSAVQVEIEVDEDTPAMLGDRKQILRVVTELITNSANTDTPTPRITLSGRPGEFENKVIISVADNGPGMDQHTMENVFLPFYSAKRAGRRRGLGLFGAKVRVENNGGRLWICSKPERGTTVYIELPSGENSGKEQDNGD